MKPISLKRELILLIILVAVMVLLPAVLSTANDLPAVLISRYSHKASIFWKIRQVTISPIFDEPETTSVDFFINNHDSLYISTPQKQIFGIADTLWTYLPKHKQIQKHPGSQVINPLAFIDSSQSLYRVLSANDQMVILKSIDENSEPDSVAIHYGKDGAIDRAEYLDANQNKVVMEFLDESFAKSIPRDNFMNNPPPGVELIDLGE